MFLAMKTAEISQDRIIETAAFVIACCLLLLTWFSERVRFFNKLYPGGNIFVVVMLLGIIGLCAALLH